MKKTLNAIDIKCPSCPAKPGIHCKRPSGHRIFGGGEHDSRYNEAERRSRALLDPDKSVRQWNEFGARNGAKRRKKAR